MGNIKIGEPRRSGKSTRLVDKYIQDLFIFGEVEIKDHIDFDQSHELLRQRVLDRLYAEHRAVSNRLHVDGMKITIIQFTTLVPFENEKTV